MRSWKCVALSLFGCLLPISAFADYTPYSVSMRSAPFQPIPIPHPQAQPPVDHTAAAGLSNRVEMDFPFRFFDVDRQTIRITPQGYVHFDSDNVWRWQTSAIPSTSAPNGFIGPWWADTDFTVGGAHLKTQILGEAPSRTLVIEWKLNEFNDDTRFGHVQLWLQEGSSTLEFHYGSIDSSSAWEVSVGIENDDGTVGYEVFRELFGTACSPNCGHDDWLENTVVTFAQGPELNLVEVQGEPEGFAGLPMRLSASVANIGGELAENFTLRFYVSQSPQVDASSIELVTLDDQIRSAEQREVVTFVANPRLPIHLEAGEYYIVAEADPHQNVPEANRSNNFAVYGPFKIGIRAPNLQVEWVDAPDLASPGEEILVRWKVSNTGNLVALDTSYLIGLASTPGSSTAWPSLATGRIEAMPMGHEEILSASFLLPDDVEIGSYFIYVEMNPDRAVFEHVHADNFALSNPVVVTDEDLVILTEEFPLAQFQGHYSVRLLAAGGDGFHRWELAEGSTLPPGLSLSVDIGENGEMATFLRGVPSRVGDSRFTLNVRSGSLSASREFQFSVLPVDFDLMITTHHLADGAFGFAYYDELFAMGGAPPYTWEARDELPLGLLLRSDGVISGRPQKDGEFQIPFRVRDSLGRETSKTLTLRISPPSGLTCVTRSLPHVPIGESAEFQLIAAGGSASTGGLIWTSGETTRLSTEIGDSPKNWRGPPPGFSLAADGVVQINPEEFGTYMWRVSVQEGASGARVDCPIRVEVPRDHGLTVLTTRLPAAVAGRHYRAFLDASGGEGELRWSEYGSGRILGDVLSLEFDSSSGALVGTPPFDILNGEAERDFAITLRVEDELNRVGIGVVTLTVRSGESEVVAKGDDGARCQTSSGALSPWVLALLGLVLLRWRHGSRDALEAEEA